MDGVVLHGLPTCAADRDIAQRQIIGSTSGGELSVESVVRIEGAGKRSIPGALSILSLTLAGDFGYGTADHVVELISRYLNKPHRVSRVQLHLRGIDFCDSYGVAQLVRIKRETARAAVPLELGQLSRTLRRVLDITGLLELLCPVQAEELRA